MTNKINQQNQIIFGGVRVNPSEIDSKKVVKENGATRYIINFYNGITVKYPAQKKTNNSVIEAGLKRYQTDTDDYQNQLWIENLAYGEITGDKTYEDDISLEGCKNCKVDVSNDDSNHDDVTFMNNVDFHDSSLIRRSENNQAKLGQKGHLSIYHNTGHYLSEVDGCYVEGKGLYKEGR